MKTIARVDAAQARRRRRLWQLGGALALAAAVVAAIVLAAGSDDAKPKLKAGETLAGQFEANARFKGIPQHGVTLGDPKAPVTLVEYADLQCPYCRDYDLNVMPAVVAKYVKTGKVKVDFRNVDILGTDSTRAAQMAAAAGMQGKLWEYVDVFYNNQGEERTGYVTDPFLRKIGSAVTGLDVNKAMNDRGIASVQAQIAEAGAGLRAGGFLGTPAFKIGPTGGTLKPMDEGDHASADAMSSAIDTALQQVG